MSIERCLQFGQMKYGNHFRLAAGARVNALCPAAKRRVGAERLILDEDLVEPLVVVDQDRHEGLAADLLDGGAVVRVDVDPLELDSLVPRRERDAFDVRGKRDPVDAKGDALQRIPTASACGGTTTAAAAWSRRSVPRSRRTRSAS